MNAEEQREDRRYQRRIDARGTIHKERISRRDAERQRKTETEGLFHVEHFGGKKSPRCPAQGWQQDGRDGRGH